MPQKILSTIKMASFIILQAEVETHKPQNLSLCIKTSICFCVCNRQTFTYKISFHIVSAANCLQTFFLQQ